MPYQLKTQSRSIQVDEEVIKVILFYFSFTDDSYALNKVPSMLDYYLSAKVFHID